jgi:hypothetical protein
MTEAEKNMLKAYAELQTKIKELSAEAEELKPVVLQVVKNELQGDETALSMRGYGKFTVCRSSKWTYSLETSTLISHVEELKKEEKAKGIANSEDNEYVRFDLINE